MNKTLKFIPMIVIFISLIFRNIQNGEFNIVSVYFIGILSGAALSLSILYIIIHFEDVNLRLWVKRQQ